MRKGNTPGFTVDPNADSYWQKYWAVILTFNRRFTDFWSMQASYTYSESTGLIAAYLSQWQSNPLYGSQPGRIPTRSSTPTASGCRATGRTCSGSRPTSPCPGI